jgi:MoaA/NifB/PqqE/SkfB family radical SAM enzyme
MAIVEKTKNNETSWVDIEGFKVHIEELIKEQIIPDYFNSPLIGLWEITRACNLRCIHCYNRSGKKLPNELSHEEKISVAKQIIDAKIFRMCLSGGEPILCESFWDLAKILKQGNVLCNTITNGSFVDESNASKYAKYFYYIQVSIDGANPKTHDKFRGKKGSWEKAVNACKLIAENKGLLSIATTVVPYNVYELDKLIDLAYNLGAVEYRLDLVSFVGQAAINHDHLVLTKEQFRLFEKIAYDKKKEYENKKLYIQMPENILKNYTASLSKIPPFFLYISPSGTCAPNSVIPFSGDSLRKKGLKEIWDELKTCHKNPEFISYTRFLKTREDFIKLDDIPYVKGELHDQ